MPHLAFIFCCFVWGSTFILLERVTHVFGLAHTDSNQHVNSIVYPRWFEDAAVRRLAQHGVRGSVLGRGSEVLFRKPFFAGQEARFSLQTFAGPADTWLAIGEMAPPAGGKPHCYLRLQLSA